MGKPHAGICEGSTSTGKVEVVLLDNARACVELFHLLFLGQLTRNLSSDLYAIKGGCNLRFFFGSNRYSEDLDIDVKTIAVNTLQNKINKILSGMPFKQILKTRQISLTNISLPKQTDTTQRWKLRLEIPNLIPLNTKIEFSRRGLGCDTLFSSIDSTIISRYKLSPILCTHYDKKNAAIQKIMALAGRPQTQARDIFDLFLLSKTSDEFIKKISLEPEVIDKAVLNTIGIKFDEYKSQVVSYLAPEEQQHYDQKKVWDVMVNDIVKQLEQLRA